MRHWTASQSGIFFNFLFADFNSETPERTVLDIFPKLEDSASYENPEIPEDENYAERFPFLDKLIQHSLKILEGEEILEEA